ncbi:MAG: 30S ribosomal protein S8 [Mycoplasma sp.]
MMTDPIADMLTRIRNANKAHITALSMDNSKIKKEIARILHEEGFITSFDVKKEENSPKEILNIELKYNDKNGVIKGIKRISKPGLRVYTNSKEMPKVLSGLGVAIVSTSKGIMTGKQAKTQNLGGEVLVFVW